jgi:hypothetical protein
MNVGYMKNNILKFAFLVRATTASQQLIRINPDQRRKKARSFCNDRAFSLTRAIYAFFTTGLAGSPCCDLTN